MLYLLHFCMDVDVFEEIQKIDIGTLMDMDVFYLGFLFEAYNFNYD